MTLQNKLGTDSAAELAKAEEKLSKKRALELFEKGLLKDQKPGTVDTLQFIHGFLFQDIYDFAGRIRQVNLAKGNFRFAPVMYLNASLQNIEKMPQNSFEKIIEKYIEMNVAHPFREGNGRSTRIWLDHILKNEIGQVVGWNSVDKNDYLMAMERSPVRDIEIKDILKNALTGRTEDRQVYMEGIDASYFYEGYSTYRSEDLSA